MFFKVNNRKHSALVRAVILLMIISFCALFSDSKQQAEVGLTVGGTYEGMLEASNVNFSPLIPDEVWYGIPNADARLRFTDPEYGFVTESARFFVVFFKNNIITSLRMSPQTEPLLLDDALRVALDLQDQWRSKGWVLTNPVSDPAFEDTPQWRERLRGIQGGRTYWQAADKYQVMMALNRFADDRRPDEERYLFSIGLGPPWTPREDEPFEVEQNCEPLAACSAQSKGSQ